jgi:hypothetical protein
MITFYSFEIQQNVCSALVVYYAIYSQLSIASSANTLVQARF